MTVEYLKPCLYDVKPLTFIDVQASFVLYRLFVKPWTENNPMSARNDGVLTYEAAPGGNRGDMTSGNAIRLVTEIHNHVADGQIPVPVHLNQTIYRNSTVRFDVKPYFDYFNASCWWTLKH